jgi:hypothetical protein
VSGTTLHGVITERLHSIAVHIAYARLKLVVMSGGGGISCRDTRRGHSDTVDAAHTHAYAHTVRPCGQVA